MGSRSTIAVRLGVLLLTPLFGLAFLGGLTVLDERHSVAEARGRAREAERVEILASASVQLEVQADSVDGLRHAASFGFDLADLGPLVQQPATSDDLSGSDDLRDLLDAMETTPIDLWADPEAVARLLDRRDALDLATIDTDAIGPDLDSIQAAMAADLAEALAAETDRLNTFIGRGELGPDLISAAQTRQAALELVIAAQEERRALADYLLPINDETDDRNHLTLVRSAAAFDAALDDVEARLSDSQQQDLDAALTSGAAQSYTDLRNDAIDRTAEPIPIERGTLALVPHGLITFVQAFTRITDLLSFEEDLSSAFTIGAQELEAQAETRLRWVMIIGFPLVAIAAAVGIVTIRSITVPVRALEVRARRITEGDLKSTAPSTGPSDIGLVHQALDELTANLQTLSDQTEALSEGRLDDEVLRRNVVGSLGASVHGSVARLRSVTSRLEYEATHDSLTALPNRAAVLSLLDRCLTGPVHERRPLAAVMLDLDGFKKANDDLGHGIGDEILVHVASRLRAQANDELVARLGGDEFMIVVPGADSAARADEIAQRSVAAIAESIAVSSGSIKLSASAGIVHTDESAWLSPSEVLRRVDLAMYQAKAGAGDVVLFDQELHDSLLETTRLQGELRIALDNDEFALDLQPILTTDDRTIVGYEALIRWHSPSRGTVSPGLFIPVAEQSDLIDQIDTWVLGRGAEILSEWKDDPAMANLTLSVNVSARHLSNPSLVARVAEVLEIHDLTAARLLIEVTESQLIPNLTRAEHVLRGLRALGVRLAIDDFGTGYASVAHLRRVRFDRIKIDRSFLAHLDDETDRSLATLLVSLGRDLELEVVAEGIEDEQQLAWARGAGCTHAQGFLLGRPGPTVDVGIRDRSAHPG